MATQTDTPQSSVHSKPELSIVMPVYNESKGLRTVMEEALAVMARAPFSCELVAVDDASTDSSLQILKEFEQKNSRVRVVKHAINKGIMGALESALRNARGHYIFFNSSDGQFDMASCLRMMRLRNRYDVIVGRRKKKIYTGWRSFVSWAFNLVPRLIFGVQAYDAGSIKLYHRNILSISLVSLSPFREAERLIKAQYLGFRIGAINVTHRERRGGRATGANWVLVWQSFLDVLRVIPSVHRNKSFISDFSQLRRL